MVNRRTVEPKIGVRNPYSQPGCRKKTSWFNCMGFGYFPGHVLHACGFNIPHLCLLGSDGLVVPLLSLAWLGSLLFLQTQSGFAMVSLLLPTSGMMSLVLFYTTISTMKPSLLSTGYNSLMMLILYYCTGNMRSEESCGAQVTVMLLVLPWGVLTMSMPCPLLRCTVLNM